jgi:hypothetical protein
LADVRRIKSMLKKPVKAVVATAVLPENVAALAPGARDFCAATHIRDLRFGPVSEAQLEFAEETAPEERPA